MVRKDREKRLRDEALYPVPHAVLLSFFICGKYLMKDSDQIRYI